MSLATVLASPVLKSALELVLPMVHDVVGKAAGVKTADKVVARVKLKALEVDGTRIVEQSKILQAELGGTPLQRSWRPIAMFVFLALLVYQVVIVTAVNAIFGQDTIAPDAQLTFEIIQVIKWGILGYIGGRSGEKIAETVAIGRQQRTTATEADDGQPPPPAPVDATYIEPPFMRSSVRGD